MPELEQEFEAPDLMAPVGPEVAPPPLCHAVMRGLKGRGRWGPVAELGKLLCSASVDPLDLVVGCVVLAFGLVEEEVEALGGPRGLAHQ